MAATSTNPTLPPLLFDLLLRSSMDFMVSYPRDAASSALLLNSSTTSCITKDSHVEDLIHTLKYLFNQALITLQVAIQQEVDPTTTLATLESLMAATSRATEHSSQSIAQTALEDLRQLNILSRQLKKNLAKHNSMASYLGITSTVAVGAAASAVPVSLIAVQPFSQLFSTVWKDRMINPLERKLEVVEANQFMIYSTIIKVGKMKDMVQGLVSLVAKSEDDNTEHDEKKLLEGLEKALVDSITQLQMVELELEIGNLS